MKARLSRIRRRETSPLNVYLLTVALTGAALLVTLTVLEAGSAVDRLSPQLAVFSGFLLLGELLTIKVPRHNDSVTASTPFMYAILLTAGALPAMSVQAVASLMSGEREQRSLLVSSFDVGKNMIALGATGLVLSALTSLPNPEGELPLTVGVLPSVVVAAIVFFATNSLLAGTAGALRIGTGLINCLREDFGFQVLTAAVFLSLSPIIVVAANYDLVFVLLLILPLIAIYRGGRAAVVNEHQAFHDGLTGLPNRLLFRDRVEQEILNSKRDIATLAVLIMDLDHFKEVNDTLGHHFGDLLLKEIGPRLESVLRESDTVARMGGDEFAVLLPNVVGPWGAVQVAEKLLEAVHEPFEVNGLTLEVGLSIGIACSPANGSDVDTLLQRADVAMFLAKEARNGYELYTPERDHYSPDRLALASDLRRAIDDGQIGPHYQPIVDVPTGDVVGAEALARWTHPVRGLLHPEDFIPIAEQTGLIRPLTMNLLSAVLAEVARWQRDRLELTVAVNVSARHLLDQQLPDDIGRLLREQGVTANRLKLEITESTIMSDPLRSEAVLRRLHAMGIRIAIDDFGTGYSSLAYLKRLPVDEIKIDRSFVSMMSVDEGDAQIVRSTIDLGHNLGLRVIGEGVETEAMLGQLRDLGCDLVQGFGLSEPLPPHEFARWVRGYDPASPNGASLDEDRRRRKPEGFQVI